MLDKKITTTGKIFTDINNLEAWDKNPRQIDQKDFERLKRQIQYLGQYKPLLVTEDGIVIGGNMRLRAMKEMGIAEVWISELAFGQEELTEEEKAAGKVPQYKAILDGKVQEPVYASVEQIMIEYAISDNDPAGTTDQRLMSELLHPHQDLIPMENYKLELAPAVSLKTFIDQFQPGGEVPGLGDDEENDTKKDKKVVFRAEFSPAQFSEIEPRIERIKNGLDIKSNADLFEKLLDIAESENESYYVQKETPNEVEAEGGEQ